MWEVKEVRNRIKRNGKEFSYISVEVVNGERRIISQGDAMSVAEGEAIAAALNGENE